MGRIRTVKPELFRHEGLYELEHETGLPIRIAFAGLFTCCDREGRFEWKPRTLKLDVLPWDECDFSRVLDALMTRGFIKKYTSEGREFGFIPSWHKHQIVNNREKDSELPNPEECQEVADASPTREARVTVITQGKGREGERKGKGKEGEGESRDTPPDETPEWKLNKAEAARRKIATIRPTIERLESLPALKPEAREKLEKARTDVYELETEILGYGLKP